MHHCLTIFLLACALSPTSVARAAQDDSPPSIETLIERYRVEREAATQALRPEVAQQISRLRDLTANERYIGSTASVRAVLVKLGSGIVPLLIEQLDPKGGKASEQRLSSQLALVLMELNLESAIDPLLKIARGGSSTGKELAVQVLGACAAPRRVNETLITLYTEQKNISRATLLTALARLKTEEGLTFVKERVSSKDANEVKAAITALTATASATAGPEIMALVLSPSNAANYIQYINAYYRACASVFNKQHAEALLQLTESNRMSIGDRITLLNLLIENEKHWPSGAEKTLKQMADTGNTQLREAVLIGLALTGDRGAKKDVIKPYENAKNANPSWGDSYADLADIQYKVHDYRDAKKNYEKALAHGIYNSRNKRKVHLGLARCCALKREFKDAEKWLKTGLSSSQILGYAGDPAFASMKEHAKYGEVFREDS